MGLDASSLPKMALDKMINGCSTVLNKILDDVSQIYSDAPWIIRENLHNYLTKKKEKV